MKRHRRFPAPMTCTLLLSTAAASANAAITTTGEVSPANPAAWGSGTSAIIGNAAPASLIVDGGSDILSGVTSLGKLAGSIGAATINGTGSTWTASSEFYVGDAGAGSLIINNGGKVTLTGLALHGLARTATSAGLLVIDGPGSVLAFGNSGYTFDIGLGGQGTLQITNGGKFAGQNAEAAIGSSIGATGLASIDGPGSSMNLGALYLSYNGKGTLSLSNGGSLSVTRQLNFFGGSLLSMSVGDNTLVSAGTITNSAKFRFSAAPSAVANTAYTPVLANVWTGTLTIQPLGGTWNTSNHTFTASTIATGTTSQPLPIDRSQQQRLQLTNPQTSSTLIANVAPTITSSTFTLTASPLTNIQVAALQTALGTPSPIFSAWTFTTSGYTAGDPVYLSLSIPSGLKARDLSLYHFDGTNWSKSSPLDFSYDGTYASFTTTELLGYAISGGLPVLGDATLDGKVDAFDLNALAAHWQQSAGTLWQNGDFNGDGKIDAFDLNTLAAHWQSGTPTALASSPVPEPGSLALLASAATILSFRRRSRHVRPLPLPDKR